MIEQTTSVIYVDKACFRLLVKTIFVGVIPTLIQLFVVSVFHHVSDTYNQRPGLKYIPKSPPGQILHVFSNHQDFILLMTFKKKINSSCTEKNNIFVMPIPSKLYRCLGHGLKMCKWFGYNLQIIFVTFSTSGS